jgi:hypothetical protein
VLSAVECRIVDSRRSLLPVGVVMGGLVGVVVGGLLASFARPYRFLLSIGVVFGALLSLSSISFSCLSFSLSLASRD